MVVSEIVVDRYPANYWQTEIDHKIQDLLLKKKELVWEEIVINISHQLK